MFIWTYVQIQCVCMYEYNTLTHTHIHTLGVCAYMYSEYELNLVRKITYIYILG